ncbi:FadR/GntR family transcriptional regulator [Enterococcus aquimarinus]|uniref:Bacterial regulatory s, gntR family protein n=1 Tax=Enterococcus aquimarinus TaxID=328396 RepID=A0A1L8QN64_9ENTE|nr:FadR/GntR family transcriptional regulator [Enterococcus aquimarinus]OJG08940.1 bacterial regulatory s, gntR family protein [Enterococcus aquimarinus]
MKKINVNNSSTSLAEQVAIEIEKLIQTKELNKGAQLPNEFELAETLNVGRGTIREAIKILSSKNVVEVLRGKGTFVSQQTGIVKDPLGLRFIQEDKIKLAHDLLEVRMMIEPEIAGLAAINATTEDILKLKKVEEEIEAQILRDESHEENDRIFHSIIASCSKNVVVLNLIPIIHTAVSLFIEVTENTLHQETITTHREIISAIENQDVENAKKWMNLHLEYNKKILDSLFETKK